MSATETAPTERCEAAKTIDIEEMLRMFGVLSHDLKSPIFSIDGFSDLLISDYIDHLDEEGQDFLRRIRSSAQQMKRTLDDMSHIIKLLCRPMSRRPTPLREIVEEVLLKHNYMIEEGGVKVDVPDNLPTLNVDPEKMRDAIGALVSNALFFNDRPAGQRTIAIDVKQDGDPVRFCVRDNGIGIDNRYTGQIFDLGLKLDKARGGGPGYGLYLAKRVAETHGGSVSVESVLGEGSAFCLTIPR
jgi:chemotaxis family two-component system sensor kinase Cph1